MSCSVVVAAWMQINKGDADGRTPLYVACLHKRHSALRLLVKLGADVERADKNNITCLMVACRTGCKTDVSYLIDKGAQVNRQDSNGMKLSMIGCFLRRNKCGFIPSYEANQQPSYVAIVVNKQTV